MHHEKVKMKKRKTGKKLLAVLLTVLMLFVCITNDFVEKSALAATEDILSEKYLNATTKYLYLGKPGADTFDFNIKKSAQEAGASYTWYINSGKGNPLSINVGKKTGIVTAKKAGTSYIVCKITLSNGKILRPEAMVTVINNITRVAIKNVPKKYTIPAGRPYDFNQNILNTAAGEKQITQGITVWEVSKDKAGIKSATREGEVLPTKKGSFHIRALCFESAEKYDLWSSNKKKYSAYVTAASDWITIRVSSSGGQATAANQEQLDKLLASNDINQITISTLEKLTFKIPQGKYADKTLIVDAENAEVNNYGLFKKIDIIGNHTWNDFADGNSIDITSVKPMKIIVEGRVAKLELNSKNLNLEAVIDGSADQISLLEPTQLLITGTGRSMVTLTIENKAQKSIVTSSIPLNLQLNADADITLNSGAEGTKINKAADSLIVKIVNNTKQNIMMTINGTQSQIIEPESNMNPENQTPTGSAPINSAPFNPGPGGPVGPVNPPATTSPVPTQQVPPVTTGPVLSSLTVTADGLTYGEGKEGFEVTKNSVISVISIGLNEGVTLADNSSATFSTANGKSVYGTIAMEPADKSNRTLIITPSGSNGIAAKTGEFIVTIPKDTIKNTAGNGNLPITFKITISEPLTIEKQFADRSLAYTVARWLGATEFDTVTRKEIEDCILSGHDSIEIVDTVTSLDGFDIFNGTSLKKLVLRGPFKYFDASGLKNLNYLEAWNMDDFQSINVSGLSKLTYLKLSHDKLTEIDLSGLSNLEEVYLNDNQLNKIELNGLTHLKNLDLCNNNLTNLNLKDLTDLETLRADENKLTDIDVSNQKKLTDLSLKSNQLSSLDLEGLLNLEYLCVANNNIQNIHVQELSNLEYLKVNNNPLTDLDVTGMKSLGCLEVAPLPFEKIIGYKTLKLWFFDLDDHTFKLLVDGYIANLKSTPQAAYYAEVPVSVTGGAITVIPTDSCATAVWDKKLCRVGDTVNVNVRGRYGTWMQYKYVITHVSHNNTTTSIPSTKVNQGDEVTITINARDLNHDPVTGLSENDFSWNTYGITVIFVKEDSPGNYIFKAKIDNFGSVAMLCSNNGILIGEINLWSD